MKIIVYGNLDKPKLSKFRCWACGCIWEADHEEYNKAPSASNEKYYMCDCPICGKTAYSDKWGGV